MAGVFENLDTKTDKELAHLQGRAHPNTVENILVQKEFQRRERLDQHSLDLKLISKQVRWMKFSAILGFIGIIIGVILGWYLSSIDFPR